MANMPVYVLDRWDNVSEDETFVARMNIWTHCFSSINRQKCFLGGKFLRCSVMYDSPLT